VLAVLLIAMLIRRDLVSKSVKLGIIGGIAGLPADLFYFRDYWRPPTVFGVARISPEEFVFGFAITALSVIAYLLLTKSSFVQAGRPNRKKRYFEFFLGGVMTVFIFNVGLGINSIFVTSFVFIILAGIILFERNDLIIPAFCSVVAVTALMIVVYVILFDVVSPQFWNKYWLLTNTKWGVTFLGNVPLTEMLWYVSWVLFASVSYPYASGKTVSAIKVPASTSVI